MPEISRRDVLAATAAGAIDRGVEAAPTVEKDNITAVTASVATISQFTASKFTKSIDTVLILGFRKPGIGALSVRRVASRPRHPWKFRSADRFLLNGSTDPTNGGWWQGFSIDGVNYTIEQFGGMGDGVTDNLPAFNNFQNYLYYLLTIDQEVLATGGSTLNFGLGSYYFSGTINVLVAMTLKGVSSGMEGAMNGSILRFANNIPGIIINRHNTNGPGGPVSTPYPGADGTILDGLTLETVGGFIAQTPLLPQAHGIWGRGRSLIMNCKVREFGNSGIWFRASSTSSDSSFGLANGWEVRDCTMEGCAGSGLRISGSDANAGVSWNTSYSGCTWAIRDDAFLNNEHHSPQTANCGGNTKQKVWGFSPYVLYNGFGYAIVTGITSKDAAQLLAAQTTRPTGANTANSTWYSLGADTNDVHSPTWGRVKAANGLIYDVIVGQETSMWTSEPSISPSVWGAGTAPTAGHFYIPWAQASAMATGSAPYVEDGKPVITGPYTFGGQYRTGQGSKYWFNNYIESGAYPLSHHAGNALIIGFDEQLDPYSTGVIMQPGNSVGVLYVQGGLSAGHINGTNSVGLADSSTHLVSMYDTVDLPRGMSFKLRNHDIYLEYNDNASDEPFYVTGPNTTQQLGRGAAQPYVLVGKNFALSDGGSNARYVYLGSSAPSSGANAQGELFFNLYPKSGAPFAWQCISTGTPGTWQALYASAAPFLGVSTYSGLPSASRVPNGTTAIITDCTSTTLGAVAAGSGSNRVRVHSDGSSHWYIG